MKFTANIFWWNTAIEQIAPIHEAVVLTYLKLFGIAVGLMINFHIAILKDGIRRYIWKEKKEFTAAAAEARRDHGKAEKNPDA